MYCSVKRDYMSAYEVTAKTLSKNIQTQTEGQKCSLQQFQEIKWNSYVYIHLVVCWERISYYSYFIFKKVASNSYSTEQYGWKKILECRHIKKKFKN